MNSKHVRNLLLVLSWFVVPPLLWLGYVVISSIAEYNGICPSIMDIPAYSCSLSEYLSRNLFSPFSFPVQVFVIGGWLTCNTMLFALAGGLLVLRQRQQNIAK